MAATCQRGTSRHCAVGRPIRLAPELGDNIKKIREQKGLLQKQLAAEVNIPYTSYNKVENNTRDIAIDELERFAGYFGMTIDQVVHFDTQPVDVTIQDKPNFEQINMINQLDEE